MAAVACFGLVLWMIHDVEDARWGPDQLPPSIIACGVVFDLLFAIMIIMSIKEWISKMSDRRAERDRLRLLLPTGRGDGGKAGRGGQFAKMVADADPPAGDTAALQARADDAAS
jgi:hypothetical protein